MKPLIVIWLELQAVFFIGLIIYCFIILGYLAILPTVYLIFALFFDYQLCNMLYNYEKGVKK